MRDKPTAFRRVQAAVAMTCLGGIAIAGGPFEVNEWTVDGGGGLSTGGVFQAIGTVGQFDASQRMNGGGFEVIGGFWAAVSCPADLNGNGTVDLGDLNIVLGAFGGGNAGDINGDGTTNLADLNLILGSFGSPC